MSYHPRIESTALASFLTTRTRNSELWFVNNRSLEEAILGYAAKFADRYGVNLYALAIEGNHIQGPAHFPNGNRSNFMRDFNACVARAVCYHTPQYTGGRLWARRYSCEFLPGPEDIEEYFFYTVLQPVKDGLVEKIEHYPGYNCFDDAISGKARKFKVVNWTSYHAAKRYNRRARTKDFTVEVVLRYARLPGYENLPQADYANLMRDKLERRRKAIVAERQRNGQGFAGVRAVRETRRGSLPLKSKLSERTSHRPRVLSVCNKRRAEYRGWYFRIYLDFKVASKKFRAGDLNVHFPEGTFRPWTKFRPPDQVMH